MPTTETFSKAASIKRHPVIPNKAKKKEIIDRKAFVEAWKPKTGILERIKNTPPDQPLVIMIQPEMAMDILTWHDFNGQRDLVEPHLNFLKGELERNDFEYTGETIKISETFKLLDMQHRLWACWETKKPFKAVIVTGIHDRAIYYIDLGKKRSAADAIAIGGHKKYNRVLANAIKNILLFKKKGQVRSSVSDQFVSVPEVNKFQENEKEMLRLDRDIKQAQDEWMRNAKNFFTLSQWVTLSYILRTLPGQEKKAVEFMKAFSSGANLKAINPIFVAHKYFVNDFDHIPKGKDKKRIERNKLSIKFNCVITAWNMSQRKETGSRIDLDPLSKDIVKPYYTRNI